MSKLRSGKPGMLREINRNLLVKLIIKNGQISRSELSKMTGLALPSVMRLIDGLILDGLVVDSGKGISSGGRKPKLVSMNKKSQYIIGVEIAIRTSLILSDISGEVIDRWESDEMPDVTPVDLLERINHEIKSLIKKHKISDKLLGIGFGTPGSNFKYVKEVKHSILKGWETTDVKSWFEERLDYDIYVDNVARTRTLAELWFGHGKTYDNFVYAFIDQGVGCGIVRNGQIIEGSQGVAGEFGHTTVAFGGKACYCGKSGCLEMYVSAGAMTMAINEKGYNYAYFSDLLHNLNQECIDILKKRSEVLAAGLGNLVNLLNPSKIILGGIVSKNKTVIDSTKEYLPHYIFSNISDETELLLSQVEQMALGSIALVINNKFTSIEITA